MAFESISDFFEMGRHGVFVWSVYGFSFLSLALLTGATLIKRRQVKEKLRKRFMRDKTI